MEFLSDSDDETDMDDESEPEPDTELDETLGTTMTNAYILWNHQRKAGLGLVWRGLIMPLKHHLTQVEIVPVRRLGTALKLRSLRSGIRIMIMERRRARTTAREIATKIRLFIEFYDHTTFVTVLDTPSELYAY